MDYDDFIACARYNEIEDLKDYIKKYPDIDLLQKEQYGNTALHMASANGHIEIVKYLININSSKEHINAQNHELNTPLHWACLNGKSQVVEYLLKFGADSLIQNSSGHSPLYEAEAKDYKDIVIKIIEKLRHDESQMQNDIDDADEAECEKLADEFEKTI